MKRVDQASYQTTRKFTLLWATVTLLKLCNMNIEHEKLRLVLIKLALLVEKAQTKQLCNRLVVTTVEISWY